MSFRKKGSLAIGVWGPEVEVVKPPKAQPALQSRQSWLRVDMQGNAIPLCVDKWRAAALLGVPNRDLRILDPSVPTPFPTAIFIRERALVLNLESTKAIITM